jgi:hypothetical protein
MRKKTKLITRNIFKEFLAQIEALTCFLLLSFGEPALVEVLDEYLACKCAEKCPIIEELQNKAGILNFVWAKKCFVILQ